MILDGEGKFRGTSWYGSVNFVSFFTKWQPFILCHFAVDELQGQLYIPFCCTFCTYRETIMWHSWTISDQGCHTCFFITVLFDLIFRMFFLLQCMVFFHFETSGFCTLTLKALWSKAISEDSLMYTFAIWGAIHRGLYNLQCLQLFYLCSDLSLWFYIYWPKCCTDTIVCNSDPIFWLLLCCLHWSSNHCTARTLLPKNWIKRLVVWLGSL